MSASTPSRAGTGAGDRAPDAYEAKHLELLSAATSLFAEKGFHNTSIRELASATDRSVAGLYYYFSGKEELLFQIQHHCYGTLLASVTAALQGISKPEDQLITFISHHIGYFRRNMDEMQVLAHEDLTLGGTHGRRLLDLKRRYSQVLMDIVGEMSKAPGARDAAPPADMAAFILFGMMNWLYTWPRKLRSLPPEKLAEVIAQIFLCGYPGDQGTTLANMRERIVCSPSRFWDGTTSPPRSES